MIEMAANFDANIVALILKTRVMKYGRYRICLNNKIEYISLLAAFINYNKTGELKKNSVKFFQATPLDISIGVISHYNVNACTYNPNARSYIELLYDKSANDIKVYSWNNMTFYDINYNRMFDFNSKN